MNFSLIYVRERSPEGLACSENIAVRLSGNMNFYVLLRSDHRI